MNFLEIEITKEMESRDPIRSNNFAATIVRAGVRKRFIQLQVLLLKIRDAEKDIHAYGSGELFRDLINIFETPGSLNPFDDQALFGTTNPPRHSTVIEETRKALRRVATSMDNITQALKLVRNIYNFVDNQVKDTNAEFDSRESRTEDLLAWAHRTGAELNPDITGARRLSLQTRATPATTNLYGLLNILDNLRLELETLFNIPAYYRTATDSNTNKIEVPVKKVFIRTGESLERVAQRELGDADKAPLIMEFNDLTPSDIFADDWNGRELSIPYSEPTNNARLANNFVLDSQSGVKVLGRDLTNDLEVQGGDLVLNQHTANLFQSLDNIIQTPAGAIPEDPEYGNRILQISNGAVPRIAGEMISTEIKRALMTNPRIASVTGITAIREQDAFKVKYQVTPVNHLTEADLEASLRLT